MSNSPGMGNEIGGQDTMQIQNMIKLFKSMMRLKRLGRISRRRS